MSDTLVVYCNNCDGVSNEVTYESTAGSNLVVTCEDCGTSEVKR